MTFIKPLGPEGPISLTRELCVVKLCDIGLSQYYMRESFSARRAVLRVEPEHAA